MASIRALCTLIFLRLYARNLERHRRREPEAACSDAIMQTGMFVSVPVVSTAWLVAVLIWPGFSRHVGALDATFLVPSIGLTLLITYWVSRQFRGYYLTPGVADKYRTGARVSITQITFILVPVLWVVVVGLALHRLAGRG